MEANERTTWQSWNHLWFLLSQNENMKRNAENMNNKETNLIIF